MSRELGVTLTGLINLLGEVRNSASPEDRQLIDERIAEVVYGAKIHRKAFEPERKSINLVEIIDNEDILARLVVEVGDSILIKNEDITIIGLLQDQEQQYLNPIEHLIYSAGFEELGKNKQADIFEVDGVKIFYHVEKQSDNEVEVELHYISDDDTGSYMRSVSWKFTAK